MSSPEERIFLSGTRKTESRTNLFRPKELREVVFPGLGMIMHSLFWIKHAFYLAETGRPIAEQDNILLWASGDDPEYTESLVCYCVYSNLTRNGEESLNAGQKTTRDWLFHRDSDEEGGVYEQLAVNLRELTTHPTGPDYKAFIDASLASWFRTRCDELGVDLEARLRAQLEPALEETDPAEQDEALAAGIATAIGQLVLEHPSLRSGKDMRVISTTTNFASRLYATADTRQREILANTSLDISAEEASALLEAVGRMDHGEHFLRSLLFVLYLDPTTHSRPEIEREMRHLYDFVVTDAEELLSTVQTKYGLSTIDSRVTDGLDATAFYWILNFFMADGETIARKLLDDAESPIDVTTVNKYFTDHPEEADRYQSFFQYTTNARPYLSQLLTELREEGSTETATFVESLISGLESEASPAELFLDLLASQGTLEEKATGQYLIETEPQNTNAATFYGIGPLVSWAGTLAESVTS